MFRKLFSSRNIIFNVFAENGLSITVLEKVPKEYMNNITSIKEKVNIEIIKNHKTVKLQWVYGAMG